MLSCDRCGKTANKSQNPCQINIGNLTQHNTAISQDVDLCPQCFKKLVEEIKEFIKRQPEIRAVQQ